MARLAAAVSLFRSPVRPRSPHPVRRVRQGASGRARLSERAAPTRSLHTPPARHRSVGASRGCRTHPPTVTAGRDPPDAARDRGTGFLDARPTDQARSIRPRRTDRLQATLGPRRPKSPPKEPPRDGATENRGLLQTSTSRTCSGCSLVTPGLFPSVPRCLRGSTPNASRILRGEWGTLRRIAWRGAEAGCVGIPCRS